VCAGGKSRLGEFENSWEMGRQFLNWSRLGRTGLLVNITQSTRVPLNMSSSRNISSHFPRTSRKGVTLLLLEGQRAAAATDSRAPKKRRRTRSDYRRNTRALLGLVIERMPNIVLRIAAVLKMPKLKFAKNLAISRHHSLLVTESGHALSCGRGTNGRLGHGDADDQPVPKRIAALRNVRIVQVSVGNDHSLMLGFGGRVFRAALITTASLVWGTTATRWYQPQWPRWNRREWCR
jgi:hypothetical protein